MTDQDDGGFWVRDKLCDFFVIFEKSSLNPLNDVSERLKDLIIITLLILCCVGWFGLGFVIAKYKYTSEFQNISQIQKKESSRNLTRKIPNSSRTHREEIKNRLKKNLKRQKNL